MFGSAEFLTFRGSSASLVSAANADGVIGPKPTSHARVAASSRCQRGRARGRFGAGLGAGWEPAVRSVADVVVMAFTLCFLLVRSTQRSMACANVTVLDGLSTRMVSR